jgi:hypothetical protein
LIMDIILTLFIRPITGVRGKKLHGIWTWFEDFCTAFMLLVFFLFFSMYFLSVILYLISINCSGVLLSCFNFDKKIFCLSGIKIFLWSYYCNCIFKTCCVSCDMYSTYNKTFLSCF